MIRPATDAKPDSTAAVSTESLAPETEAETVAAESTVYRTTDTVNVRPEPSTDTDRIGVLAPDTDVEYLRDYDEKMGGNQLQRTGSLRFQRLYPAGFAVISQKRNHTCSDSSP